MKNKVSLHFFPALKNKQTKNKQSHYYQQLNDHDHLQHTNVSPSPRALAEDSPIITSSKIDMLYIFRMDSKTLDNHVRVENDDL